MALPWLRKAPDVMSDCSTYPLEKIKKLEERIKELEEKNKRLERQVDRYMYPRDAIDM